MTDASIYVVCLFTTVQIYSACYQTHINNELLLLTRLVFVGNSARFNTLRPRQNGRHIADDMFKCIFVNENAWIPIEISLKLVPQGSINNNPALFQIMAWRRPGDKPLSEPMMVSWLTHICITRPQWVKLFTLYFALINILKKHCKITLVFQINYILVLYWNLLSYWNS